MAKCFNENFVRGKVVHRVSRIVFKIIQNDNLKLKIIFKMVLY